MHTYVSTFRSGNPDNGTNILGLPIPPTYDLSEHFIDFNGLASDQWMGVMRYSQVYCEDKVSVSEYTHNITKTTFLCDYSTSTPVQVCHNVGTFTYIRF